MDEDRLTLRDTFAIAALQGLLAHVVGLGQHKTRADYAVAAYEYADAMLAVRERVTQQKS